jgi:hypothetical protein
MKRPKLAKLELRILEACAIADALEQELGLKLVKSTVRLDVMLSPGNQAVGEPGL